jgi:hypothetical protein
MILRNQKREEASMPKKPSENEEEFIARTEYERLKKN